MQPFDSVTAYQLAQRLHTTVVGKRINRLQQPNPVDWVLHLWGSGGGGSQKLWLHLCKGAPFVAWVTTEQLHQAALPQTRSKPSGFGMVMRKHLLNAKLVAVTAPVGEASLTLHCEATDELGWQRKPQLVIEVMGKHTNLILVDGDTQQILGCATHVTDEMSRQREVLTGLPFMPAPTPQGKAPLSEWTLGAWLTVLATAGETPTHLPSPAVWPELWAHHCWGVKPAVLADVLTKTLTLHPTAEGKDLATAFYQHVQGLFSPQALLKAVAIPPSGWAWEVPTTPPPEGDDSPDTTLAVVSNALWQGYCRTRLQQLRHQLQQPLTQAQKKLKGQWQQAQTHAQATQVVSQLQHQGQCLLSALSMGLLAQPYATTSTLTLTIEGMTQGEETFSVTPGLAWAQQAQQWFRLARKAKRRVELAQHSLAKLATQQGLYTELARLLAQADSVADVQALQSDWVSAGLLANVGDTKPPKQLRATHKAKHHKQAKLKQGEAGATKTGVLTLLSADGVTLEVGKTAQANARLAGKWAKPTDVWFHVQGMPSAHVLVRWHGQAMAALPKATVELAASLAAYYSDARGAAHVPVVMTQARYVRAIPGSWPGHVTYTHEQSLTITPDADVLVQVLQQSAYKQAEA
jgi:predicted ribosome quality control (RQC) complex YloA/Tae2 family protein